MQARVSRDQEAIEATRRRVAAHKRMRAVKWLLLLAVVVGGCFFGGPRLAQYMWGAAPAGRTQAAP